VVIVFTSFALISFMFSMVRVTDPLMPRAMFGSTRCSISRAAPYPQSLGVDAVIAVADPFTYAVHAFKSLC
jgi:hypothetical protein